MADKLPRGVLRASLKALADSGAWISSADEAKVRMALEVALPLIERDVQRKAARHVLALDGFDQRQMAATNNRGPFYDMRTSLRKLARGEELADVDAVREELSDVSATPGSDRPS